MVYDALEEDRAGTQLAGADEGKAAEGEDATATVIDDEEDSEGFDDNYL